MVKKSCNLISWEHFGLYLLNKIFPKYRICAETQQIKFSSQNKFSVINDQNFFKLKKHFFGTIFGSFLQFLRQNKFFWNIQLCQAQLDNDF